MSEIRLHRAAVLRPFAAFLEKVGAPVEQGFRRAKLPYSALEDADHYVPSQRFYAFITDMAGREHLPYLGFQAGQGYGANGVDPRMVRLVRGSPTVYSGLSQASELINRTISHCQVGIEKSKDGRHAYFYHWPSCDKPGPAREQIAWFGLTVLMGIMRACIGPDWYPSEIGVAAVNAPDDPIRAHFPGARIRLWRSRTYVRMSSWRLGQPIHAAKPSAGKERVVKFDPIEGSAAGALRQLLRTFATEEINLGMAAELINTSKRSLQRLLHSEGTSFSRLLDEIRFELALKYLQEPGVPIAEVAYLLGYRNPANFSRSFQRIAGVSPRSYRKAGAVEPRAG